MAEYEVYATAWNDPHVVEELLPARDLSFSMPLSDHGECSFSATVEPGKSPWRAAITPALSGILICRDDVPVWSGWVTGERESGGRSFQFTAREWGSIFARFPAPLGVWSQVNDHALFRAVVNGAQSGAGRGVQVQTPDTAGLRSSDLTVNAWDNLDAEEVFRRIADAEGGPEWYFHTAGTRSDPKRVLMLADRHGTPTVAGDAVLTFVEDTEDWPQSAASGGVVLLGDLFPVGSVVSPLGRRGGNVLEKARTRDTARATTRAVAVGDGTDAAQLQRTARANNLIDRVGWPELTSWAQHSSVSDVDAIQRHANADLRAASGITTNWAFSTLDGDPDWTQIPRGSLMRAVLDTDVYAGPRPLVFESRLLNVRVDVPDDGAAQVQWELAETLEVS